MSKINNHYFMKNKGKYSISEDDIITLSPKEKNIYHIDILIKKKIPPSRLEEYKCRTSKLVAISKSKERYIVCDFFTSEDSDDGLSSSSDSETAVNSIIPDEYEKNFREYIGIAKEYVTINIKSNKDSYSKCEECENDIENAFVTVDNVTTCLLCGKTEINLSSQNSFKDSERINLCQKYRYKKRVHFKDTLNQYQGKQTKKIPQKLFDDLEFEFKKIGVLLDSKNFHERHKNVNKKLINILLRDTKNNTFYEDINLIYSHFTGIALPDIFHIETSLYEDFDKIVEVYDSFTDINRKNFLNAQYILYQLLKKHGQQVNENDFDILKTSERLIMHDNIYWKICSKLNWSFTPLSS